MKHLGDITKISGYAAPSVDVIIGGSPCQDLSVAGKRAGLNGVRSGLFMEQIRIIKEMREASEKSGAAEIRPRYMVWENVLGAFSSNDGDDFRVVLEETARIADKGAVIPRPANWKWRTCGCIMGNGWSVAWRVLDAQFWGVPQHRRRIALVADFGGESAPEILFVRKSLQGRVTAGGETRERAAADTERSVGKAIGFNYLMGSKAGSVGAEEEQSETLRAGSTGMAVCYDMSHADEVIRECGENALTLQNRMGTSGNQVPICLDRSAYNQGKNAKYAVGIDDKGTAFSLTSKGPGAVCYAVGNGQKNQTDLHEKSGALNCMHDQQAVMNSYGIRRLTPLECERLQGYPDNWTNIGEWTDDAGKVHKTSDAARYKALGNSIALPPWRWVIKRLCACYERNATMASLFDGIGGFPLIWEELNGKGSCLWASEIEEFPIAVTKYHFGVHKRSGEYSKRIWREAEKLYSRQLLCSGRRRG